MALAECGKVPRRSRTIAVACSSSFIMKTVKRFNSFEDLKAHESSVEAESIMLERHHAFEKLMALIRSKRVRKSDRSRR